LVISIGRPDYIAPKIRYNIHDRGHVLPMKELKAILKELAIDESQLVKAQTDLPLLLHYGRADSTVSFFGANISPTDIQETIYNSSMFSDVVNSFCIGINENDEGDKQLVISLELQQNQSEESLEMGLAQSEFFGQLAKINQDFREAKKMASKDDQTVLCFYPFHTGPFEDRDIRIKAKYFQ